MRLTDIRRTVFLLALSGVVVGVSLGAVRPLTGQNQRPDPILDEVRAAWKKRQEAVSALQMTWNSKTTTPKGALTGLLPDVNHDSVIPPTDSVHNGTGAITLEGKKARITQRMTTWHVTENKFLPRYRESTFDGKLFTVFTKSEPGNPSAIIRRTTHNQDGEDMMITPILASVRGLDSDLVTQNHYLELYPHARRLQDGKRSLIEITRPRDESRGEGKMWLDPAQDFAVVRNEQYNRDGKLILRITITQSRVASPSGTWLPERWTSTMFKSDGKMLKQVEVTALTREVNVATSPSDFQLHIPPNTRVVDNTGSEPKQYIAREDGTNREILRSEYAVKHEDLVRTNTGDLGSTPGATNPWRWALIIGGVVVCVVSLWLLARARRSPRAGPEPTT